MERERPERKLFSFLNEREWQLGPGQSGSEDGEKSAKRIWVLEIGFSKYFTSFLRHVACLQFVQV